MVSNTCGWWRVVVFLTALCAPLAWPPDTRAQETAGSVQGAEWFPPELVQFVPYKKNPVFTGAGGDSWDQMIRERGFILFEEGTYHLWYTGYRTGSVGTMSLGYASSADGIHWLRSPENPIFTKSWVEDMCVVRHDNVYYMFAEGLHDIAHLLTSPDRLHWTEHGSLDVRKANGEPIERGPYGTPTIWVEDGIWYLFYERRDAAVWLATSKDRRVWTNVQDEPVIARGPERYDQHAVALNQVLKYKGRYYGYYHGTAHQPWKDWTTNVAVSEDLVHWKKYPQNPIISGDKSSGIVVFDGRAHRLYTMHPDVRVYFHQQRSE